MKILNISEGKNLIQVVEAIQGKWLKQQNEIVRLTILKSLLFISSDIVSKETNISVELPEHGPFYISIIGSEDITRVKIERNAKLEVLMPIDTSLFRHCKYIKE